MAPRYPARSASLSLALRSPLQAGAGAPAGPGSALCARSGVRRPGGGRLGGPRPTPRAARPPAGLGLLPPAAGVPALPEGAGEAGGPGQAHRPAPGPGGAGPVEGVVSVDWPEPHEFDLPDTPVWERQAGEPTKAHGAFRIYRDTPVSQRDIARVAEQVGISPRRAWEWAAKWEWRGGGAGGGGAPPPTPGTPRPGGGPAPHPR